MGLGITALAQRIGSASIGRRGDARYCASITYGCVSDQARDASLLCPRSHCAPSSLASYRFPSDTMEIKNMDTTSEKQKH